MSRDAGKTFTLVLSLFMLIGICSPLQAASYNGKYVNDGSTFHIEESADVYTDSDFHPGLEALYAGSTISADNYVKIKTTGDLSDGVLANVDGTIRIGRSADITTQGYIAHGVEAWNGGSVYLGSGGTIETNGYFSAGLFARGGDYAALISADDDLTITTNYTGGNPWNPSDEENLSYGIMAINDGFVSVGDRLKVTTYGTSSSAVRVNEGGDVRIGGDAVLTTYGKWASGIDARQENYVYIGNNAKISTSGYNANGILALWGGNVSTGDDLTINTSHDLSFSHGESYSNGIWVEGSGSLADIGDRLKVTTYGAMSRGIGVWNEGTVEIGDGGTIETYGYNALGLWVNASGGTASFTASDGLTINTYAKQAQGGDPFDVTNPYDYAHAIFAEMGATVRIGDGLAIATKGSASEGARALAYNQWEDYYSDVLIRIGKDAMITTEGEIAHGLLAWYEGAVISIDSGLRLATAGDMAIGLYALSEGKIETGDEIRVSTSGESAWAAAAYDGGTLDIGNKTTLSTSGEGADALLAEGDVSVGDELTVSTSGLNAYGILAQYSGYAEIGKNADISTTNTSGIGVASIIDSGIFFGSGLKVKTGGDYAYGIFARENGYVEIGPGSQIITGGVDAHAVYALSGGRIIIDGGTIIARDASSNAIFAENSYYFNNDSHISGTGVFSISGDIVALADYSDAARVELNMEDGSTFTGAAVRQGLNVTEAELRLGLQGASTRWNITGDSYLTELSLNGSTVSFAAPLPGTALTTDTLSGTGGTFRMTTDMSSMTGDRLSVTSSSAGSYTIGVTDYGNGATDQNTRFTLIEDAEGTAEFALAGGYANIGLWRYGLTNAEAARSGASWQLYSLGVASDPASAAVNTFRGAWLMGYAETQTLIQRMGDLRSSPNLSGVWFRVHGGKLEADAGRFARAFDMEYGGVQIGFDRKFDKWNGNLYLGAMFGYADGDLDFDGSRGDGSIESKTLGVYGTYVRPDGFYLDAVVKYQWTDNKFHTVEPLGDVVNAPSASMGGFGMSLEAGKRFQVGEIKNGGGWYIEPQAQISYQYYDGGSFRTNNNLEISADDFKSLTGRVGALIGYQTEKSNFYAKVSIVKEFDGDMTVRSGVSSFEESFGDDWFVYGIGFTSRVNDRNSLYLDVERTSGGDFTQPWRVSAGWRLEF